MAHSWVMFYGDELESFRKFARVYPDNCILLADTYNVLKSAVDLDASQLQGAYIDAYFKATITW